MPVPEPGEGVNLNVADFKEMIQQVAFAASVDEARHVLQGVLLTIEGEEVTMAATDGFRVSVRKATLSKPTDQPVSVIINARALSELARIAVNGDETMRMIVPPGRGQVIFHLKDVELDSQLIEGNFPDYKAIIPHAFKTRVVVSTSEILKSCRQAEIIAREGNNVIRMNIQPKAEGPGVIEISAQSEETGQSEIQFDANIEGPGLIIAFNVKYLREVLEVLKSPSLALQSNTNVAPALLQPIGDDNFLHVIMPMSLH